MYCIRFSMDMEYVHFFVIFHTKKWRCSVSLESGTSDVYQEGFRVKPSKNEKRGIRLVRSIAPYESPHLRSIVLRVEVERTENPIQREIVLRNTVEHQTFKINNWKIDQQLKDDPNLGRCGSL